MLENYGHSSIYLKYKDFKVLAPLDCGWGRCRPGHAYGPAIRDYYLIHYVRSGCGIFKNDRGEHHVSAGQLFVIRPGEVTYYKASDDDPWYYSWIGMRGELASVFDTAPDVITADCKKYFDAMAASVEYETRREEVVAGQLFLMIAELFGTKGDGKRTNGKSFAAIAANFIEYHYMQPISVSLLADEMNIDRRYLSRLFKREYGMTMQDFIVASRMKHAAEFLADGYSVAQSANMTGYTDVFNFSKMFKKYHGVSPSDVKRRNKC